MKDVTQYVVKYKKKFWVDREDVNTGTQLVKPGDEVCFTHNGKKREAIVSTTTQGRDDDTYLLELK